MERDKDAYVADVGAIARELEMAFDEGDPLKVADAIRLRLETALRNKEERTRKKEELEEAEAQRGPVVEKMAVSGTSVSEMTRFFGVASMVEVNRQRDRVIRLRQLQGTTADLESRIRKTLRASSIDEAETELAGLDGDALRSEFQELGARFQDQDRRREKLFAAYSKADDAVKAVGGDDAAARIEEKRQTVLTEIEERTVGHGCGQSGNVPNSAHRLPWERAENVLCHEHGTATSILAELRCRLPVPAPIPLQHVPHGALVGAGDGVPWRALAHACLPGPGRFGGWRRGFGFVLLV